MVRKAMGVVTVTALVIGVATTSAARVGLSRLLGGAETVLLVSSAEQARMFLGLAEPIAPVPEPPPSGLTLDSDRAVLRWQDREITLTRLEHDFLRCLASEPGQIWTHQRLHLAVWGNEHLGRGSDIHSVVKRLRRKLTRLGAPQSITAIRGIGFRLLAAQV